MAFSLGMPNDHADALLFTIDTPQGDQQVCKEGRKTNLMHLPDEIIYNVSEFVSDKSQADLLHLAMCSRRLHAIAEPMLYRDFCEPDHSDTDIVQFMCRILARPDLARQVVSFRGYCSTRIVKDGDSLDIQEEDWVRIHAAVGAISQPENDYVGWIGDIKHGLWDSIAVLLLCLVPNLQELGFDYWAHDKRECEHYFPRLMIFFRRAAELQIHSEISPLAMSNVRSVSIQCFDTRGMEIDAIVPFLSLKRVTSFSANWISGETLKWFAPSMSFSTKGLSLEQSVFDHRVMTQFLRCFPTLERLSYRHGEPPIGQAYFEPPKMMEALEHLKPCLEELSILNYPITSNSELRYFPMGSFREFRKLKSIEITVPTLIGLIGNHNIGSFVPQQRLVEAIPPCLQYLTLRQDVMWDRSFTGINEQIFELITQKQRYTPELEHLDMEWKNIIFRNKLNPPGLFVHPGFTREEADELLVTCKAAGVKIVETS